MKLIRAAKVLYIKLGKKGLWEKDCIENRQIIRLGFRETDHNDCLNNKWDKIKRDIFERYINIGKHNPGREASKAVNEIKSFYTTGEDNLWITFYANKLWWCFCKEKTILLPDKTKYRRVIGKWSCQDIKNNELRTDTLSGKLLKMQGYQRTICSVKESAYVINKINCIETKELAFLRNTINTLNNDLTELIKHLHWKDFEILIDLIFRQAGWQRVSQIGKTQKTIDIELLMPVTGERALVQVKSQSDGSEYHTYVSEFNNMSGYSKLFYVVHTPDKSLVNSNSPNNVLILYPEKIAKLAISAGLIDWIVSKVS